VVSDAGPLIHLAQIDKLLLLKTLFGNVLITDKVKIEVFDEGARHGCPDAQLVGTALESGWLKVEPLPRRLVSSVIKLAEGENISLPDAESLLLAVDKKAFLLVDDKSLSNLAKMYRLKVLNTWTLLLEGLSQDLVELNEIKDAIDKLRKIRFSLNGRQAREILNAANIIEEHKREGG
jgi:predicted nucleic acid-binding protein